MEATHSSGCNDPGRSGRRVGQFDYVIVGAGSAGCVLASRLSEDPDVQVALLESGPGDDSALIQCPGGLAALGRAPWLTQSLTTVPQDGLKGRCGHQPRGRTLGGSSSVNAMVYVRGQPGDYDAWAAMGNPGWGWSEVLPWFIRMEHNERLGGPWHGQHGPLNVADLQSPNVFSRRFVDAGIQAGFAFNDDFNGANQEGVGLYQVTQKSGERFSAAKAYLHPHRGRTNLHVFTGVTADRVELNEGRAGRVHALQGGVAVVFDARREVLLSAGAFQSPAMLLRSGIGPGHELQALGIPVVCDLPGVGANLHDHPDVVLVADAPGQKSLFGLTPSGVWDLVRAGWQWHRQRNGRLTTNFAEAGGFLRTDPSVQTPDVQLHFVVAKLVNHGRQLTPGHGFSLHVCVLQPRSRGRVWLKDRHPQNAPLIDPQFLSDPQDVQTLLQGVHLARRILQQAPLADHGREISASAAATSDGEMEQWIRQHADTIYHPVGTCRMGTDALAVVDPCLRVRGVQGLRVVDASVMPRITSGNTNAPTIMIAEKTADLIRRSA